MPDRSAAAVAYLVFVGLLWGVALPAVLVADAAGPALPWRGPIEVGFAIGGVLAGLAAVDAGARTLAASGVGLFGVRPGPVLVTGGIYGRVRNPIEIGVVVVSVAVWVALDVDLIWVIPVGTAVWSVAGVGPYEDRLLLEEFGDEFREYRSMVRKWVPRRR